MRTQKCLFAKMKCPDAHSEQLIDFIQILRVSNQHPYIDIVWL